MLKFDDIGNPDAPHGSREWCAAKRLEVQSQINDTKARVGSLRIDLKTIRDRGYFLTLQDKNGDSFQTWEDFCQFPRPWGLGFSAAVANAVIEESDGDKLVATVASEVMARTVASPRNGEIGNGRSPDNIRPTQHGTSAEYLAGRIKRDRPDIARAVERGEYRSIRQAALAAGIVREKSTIDRLLSAWRKATPDEREDFLDQIGARFG